MDKAGSVLLDREEQGALHVPEAGLWAPGFGLFLPEAPKLKGLFSRLVHDEVGAFASSGLYLLNWIDILDNTQLAIDTSLTSHKWALYTDTLTPNFSTGTGYSATNEATNAAGTGYTAGGRTILAGGGSPTTTESPSGTLMYDQNDMVWPAATSTTAHGAILYADALAGDNLIVAMTFGADIVSTAGTFTIQFAAGGVFTIDLTP